MFVVSASSKITRDSKALSYAILRYDVIAPWYLYDYYPCRYCYYIQHYYY